MQLISAVTALVTSLNLAASLAGAQAPASTQDSATVEAPFPPSTALAEGISPEALGKLDLLVQSFVDAEEVVGAELLVIVNGRTIHHDAYGWSDLEAKTPMQTGNVFCVRSMTKPLIGTAILMLADDKQLKLSDKVSKYIPALDIEAWREITLQHLITHTTGLPYSLIAGKELQSLGDIQSVAALGAGYKLDFEPGTAFQYSDQGTDTLTAVIEVVSGMPAADFVRTRILEPLAMQDSTCFMTEDHPLRARALPKYLGGTGLWTRFWSPDDPSLFPFFLGSQGLYSTLEDYAKFMEFWRRKGRTDDERLLAVRLSRKALTPTNLPFPAGSGFADLQPGYGYLMQLWTGPGDDPEDDREMVAFGHTGSDGTHAWVFPKQKAIVMYFTQSRNNPTGVRVEEALSSLFLGAPYDPNQAAPPLEQYLGYYQENEPDLYRAIVRDGDGLGLEIRGRGVVTLSYMGEDRWKFRDNPGTVLEFDRSPEGGVNGFHIGAQQEFRFEPSADLPSVDELLERHAQAHGLALLEGQGPMRIRGKLYMDKLGLEGDVTSMFAWPNQFRVDSVIGEEFERAAFDGAQVRYSSKTRPLEVMEGARAATMRTDNLLARFGDLRSWHSNLRVIEKDEREGEVIYLLRTGDTSGPATTMYIHWETGRLMMVDSIAHIDGMGRVGQRQKFEDYREVHGMLLPHRVEISIPNPIIGKIVGTIESVELGVEIPEGTFELAD